MLGSRNRCKKEMTLISRGNSGALWARKSTVMEEQGCSQKKFGGITISKGVALNLVVVFTVLGFYNSRPLGIHFGFLEGLNP